jgi:hypothetical protein
MAAFQSIPANIGEKEMPAGYTIYEESEAYLFVNPEEDALNY